MEGHRLGPLAGLIISSTGHGSDEKAGLARLIEMGGGEYSGNLTKQCTHLVLKRADDGKVSAKERFAPLPPTCQLPGSLLLHLLLAVEQRLGVCRAARAWKTVRIVWDAWLHDTLEAGVYRADEHAYAVQPHPGMPLQQPQPQLGPVGVAHGQSPPPAGPPAVPTACAATASAGCSNGAGLRRGFAPAAAAAGLAAPPMPTAFEAEPARSIREAQESNRCEVPPLLAGLHGGFHPKHDTRWR